MSVQHIRGDGGYKVREYAPVPEDVLIHAYARTERTVPCACGGRLSAPPNDETMVRLAVERHQRTPRHRAWWRASQ